MKQAIYITILLLNINGCITDECQCEITNEELKQINFDLTELTEAIGYDWQQNLNKIGDKPYKSYHIKMDNVFFNHIKTYRLVKTVNTKYIEIILSSKYIKDKRTNFRAIKQRKIDLSTDEWNEFENTFQHTCFWTKKAYVEKDTTSTDILSYFIEGIDTNENPCTKNPFHRIIRHSRTDPDIEELISQLTKIEPMNDLDSLNRISISKQNE